MEKEYKVKIRSIQEWNGLTGRYNYSNTSEALHYLVCTIAGEKDFGLIMNKSRKDKLIVRFCCDSKTYDYIKMRFVCSMGAHFEWID